MQDVNIREIALEVLRAADNVNQIDPITSRFENFTIADAYEVAHFVHEKRLKQGWAPVGRKIGFTNAAMWSQYGVREPIWGYMYDRTVTQLTGQRAECFIGKFCEPKIEPEIVLHFGSTPSLAATTAELLKCIDWIALGFEIVQSHFPGWEFQAADTIADGGLHGELFIGERQTTHQLGRNIIQNLETFEIALSCDSTLRETGNGANALGSPLKAVLHLLSVLSGQSGAMPIQAGEVITTGTLTSAFRIDAGEDWSACLKGISLPDLSIRSGV